MKERMKVWILRIWKRPSATGKWFLNNHKGVSMTLFLSLPFVWSEWPWPLGVCVFLVESRHQLSQIEDTPALLITIAHFLFDRKRPLRYKRNCMLWLHGLFSRTVGTVSFVFSAGNGSWQWWKVGLLGLSSVHLALVWLWNDWLWSLDEQHMIYTGRSSWQCVQYSY